MVVISSLIRFVGFLTGLAYTKPSLIVWNNFDAHEFWLRQVFQTLWMEWNLNPRPLALPRPSSYRSDDITIIKSCYIPGFEISFFQEPVHWWASWSFLHSWWQRWNVAHCTLCWSVNRRPTKTCGTSSSSRRTLSPEPFVGRAGCQQRDPQTSNQLLV